MPGLRRLAQSRREQELDFSAKPIHSIVHRARSVSKVVHRARRASKGAQQSPQCKQGNQTIESVSCDGEGKSQE